METPEKLSEYLKSLEGGHSIVTEQYAEEVCKAFDVPYDKKLSHKQLGTTNWQTGEKDVSGVWDLSLLYHIADKMKIETTNSLMGKGFQAEFVADRIRQSLNIK